MGGERDDRSFVISSWVFGRALGGVLLIAFVSLGVQVQGLFGSRGITPIANFVASARGAGHTFWAHPSALWWGSGDAVLTVVWVLGAMASLALLVGFVPRAAALVCWFTYLSFVSVGWPFMSFQWDTLLLEVVFTSIFFVPSGAWDRFRTHREPHPLARWALWWLLFRLVFRSAYVKLASDDPTWADLTALTYHYWTQPLPTALGWYAHWLPAWFHKLSCAGMFVIEFLAPLALFVPRAWARRAAGGSIILLMVLILLTGNYGFFNWLTIALCLTVFDDRFFRRFVPSRFLAPSSGDAAVRWVGPSAIGPALVIALSAVVFVHGTFGERMPGWLRPVYPFSTFNNYGLFAVMTTDRPEIIIEGSRDGETWEPYVFRFKPGPLERAPVMNAPHQPRLDWQMWFAALGNFRRNAWLGNLMTRLLQGESTVLELMGDNPFEKEPPKQIRAILYRYEFTTPDERKATGNWWKRRGGVLYAPILGVPIGPASTAE